MGGGFDPNMVVTSVMVFLSADPSDYHHISVYIYIYAHMSHYLMAGLITHCWIFPNTFGNTHTSLVSSLFIPSSPLGPNEGGNHAAESRGAADDAKFGPGLCKRSPLSTGFDEIDFDPLNLKALEKNAPPKMWSQIWPKFLWHWVFEALLSHFPGKIFGMGSKYVKMSRSNDGCCLPIAIGQTWWGVQPSADAADDPEQSYVAGGRWWPHWDFHLRVCTLW